MWYELYLYLLLSIKLFELYCIVWNRLKPSTQSAEYLFQTNRVFTVCMTLLMIYLFHPRSRNPVTIDRETKLFLFTFACLTLVHSSFA
jgi:uncharacterized protein YhhL (DUF1145 family)